MADKITDYAVNSARWLSLEDFEGEVWKDVLKFDGLYQVSNYGRVKSTARIIVKSNGKEHHVKEKILKIFINKGYVYVTLSKMGKQPKFKVHRLVAIVFLSNPDNFPDVNHKNENKNDNRVCNLEWCTKEYNYQYGTRRERVRLSMRDHHGKTIVRYDLLGTPIKTYQCTKDLEFDGFDRRAVDRVCKNITHKYRNSIWRYLGDEFSLMPNKREIVVYKYDLQRKLVERYKSIREAEIANEIKNRSIRYLRLGERRNPIINGFIYSFTPLQQNIE